MNAYHINGVYAEENFGKGSSVKVYDVNSENKKKIAIFFDIPNREGNLPIIPVQILTKSLEVNGNFVQGTHEFEQSSANFCTDPTNLLNNVNPQNILVDGFNKDGKGFVIYGGSYINLSDRCLVRAIA